MRILSLLLVPLAAHAAPLPSAPAPSLQDVMAGVTSTYKGVETLQADFVQVTKSAAMGDGLTQKGTVRIARPEKMSWRFTTPDERAFVTDGATMWVWSKPDNQVTVMGGAGLGDNPAASLLTDLSRMDDVFSVSVKGRTDAGDVVLGLVPKDAGSVGASSLEVVVDGKSWLLEKVTLTDAMANKTEISFSNVKVNPALGPETFTFAVPKGATVVKADEI